MKNNWQEMKLGEVVELKYGFGLSEKNRIHGHIPVYGSSGIIGYHNQSPVKGPGIVVGRKGNVGSVSYSNGDFWPIDTTYYTVENRTYYDLKFLFFLLKNLCLYTLDNASAVPGLSRESFYNITAKFPSLSVQQKIASILSAYDDLIELNERRIKILEEMARLIYKEWFVKFRFPGHEKVKMVKSKLGMIPEGWEVKKLEEILLKIPRTKKVKKEEYLAVGEIPTIDQGNDFIGGYTNDIEAKHTEPLPIIVFGDHTRIIKYIDFPFACGADGTQLIYPNNKNLTPAYLYFVLRHIRLTNYSYARHFKYLKEEEILLPKIEIVQEFNRYVSILLNQMSLFRKQNQKLKAVRNMFLPKLINGNIVV